VQPSESLVSSANNALLLLLLLLGAKCAKMCLQEAGWRRPRIKRACTELLQGGAPRPAVRGPWLQKWTVHTYSYLQNRSCRLACKGQEKRDSWARIGRFGELWAALGGEEERILRVVDSEAVGLVGCEGLRGEDESEGGGREDTDSIGDVA